MDADNAASMLALTRQAGPHLQGPDAAQWLDRLEQKRDELRAALRWLIAHGRGADALALVAAMWRLWLVRGEPQEGNEWLSAALNAPGAAAPSSDRAKALYAAGLLAFRQGENERSRRLNEESLAVAREMGDQVAAVDALVGLARVALRDGDYAAVRARCEEGMAIAGALGERRAQALPLHLLAAVTRMEGDYEGARRLYRESIALSEELGDRRAVALERINLGCVEVLASDFGSAEPHLRAGLRAVRELGAQSLIPTCLIGLAAVAEASGDGPRAARLLGAAEAELDATGTTLDPDDQPMYEAALARAQATVTAEAFTAGRSAGRAMTLDEAIADALGETR